MNRRHEVVAWMPLPEPYKEENHEGCSLMQAAKETRCEDVF